MGFRNKHRRGRGGGGGGGHHHHHHHGFGTGEPNGLQPGDDVGNRKSFKVVQHPPDDIGNRKDPEEVEWVPVDDVGNRIDAAPTHEISGTLLDVDGKGRRRRRPKGVAAPERVGRYFVGGVNPLIATNTPRPFPGKTLEESMGGPPAPRPPVANDDGADARDDGASEARDAHDEPREGEPRDGEHGGDWETDERGGRRRRRRGRGNRDGRFEPVDGVQAQEVSERRTQRFFDFDEDDRFEYTLKTSAEQKRKEAEDAVRAIVVESGRDATVTARLIEDGNRPKILVTIAERGASSSLPAERRAHNAGEPLFVIGNAALMSLNYLVNKIVNRYPDDRIRLAILPAADERLYLDALAEHQKTRKPEERRPAPASGGGHTGNGRSANGVREAVNGALPDTRPVVAVPQPSVHTEQLQATPSPVGPAAPPEAFDPPVEKPRPEKAKEKPPELAEAEQRIAEKVKQLDEEAQEESGDDEDEGRDDDDGDDGDEGGDDDEAASIDDVEGAKPKTTKKKASAAGAKKKKASTSTAKKKAPAKKAAKKAPAVEKATVKKR